jgi:hypothetical protein
MSARPKAYRPLGISDNRPDWFYPERAAHAPYNAPIVVRDTDSALGRYNLQTKEIFEGYCTDSWSPV